MTSRAIVSIIVALLVGATGGGSSTAAAQEAAGPARVVRDLLEKNKDEIDFAGAKLAFDKLVDPSLDTDAALDEIERMEAVVRKMIATLPPEASSASMERMKALRAFIYEAGWWNGNRPFEYDLDDPYGQAPGSQLLSSYLESRKGNCVSMPILFLVLGERIGLDVTLSTAPLHIYVKWTDTQTGETWNLETTSGAGFTRDIWYRQKLPITDEAIENGVYMKTLSRRETLSVLAVPVLDKLLREGEFEEAIAVADVLLEAWPTNAYVLVKKGTAYYRMLERDIMRRYPDESDIPADKIGYANELYHANQDAFARAEALGWRMPTLD